MEDFDFIVLEGLDFSALDDLVLDPAGYDVDVSPSGWEIDEITDYFDATAPEFDTWGISENCYAGDGGVINVEA